VRRLALLILSICLGLVGVAGVAAAQQPILPPSRPGFPAVLPGSGSVRAIGVGDLDGNGDVSLIVGTRNRQLWVLNNSGTGRGGWPRSVPAVIEAQPVVANLDGTGPKIIVATGSTLDPGGVGSVTVFNPDGTQRWQRRTVDGSGIFSSPAVVDLDGDGLLEIIVGAFDQRVYVFRADGTDQPGWPRFVSDSVWSSPALADLDGDGRLEIIIGADAHLALSPSTLPGPCNPFSSPPVTPNGGALIVFRSDGSPFPGFPICIDETVMSSPAVGDLDGDGIPEIVVGTGRFYATTTGLPVGRRVYAFRRDGTLAPGWPQPVGSTVFSSPALADLTGDGRLDVVVGSDDGFINAFRGFDGAPIFRVPVKSFFGTSNPLTPSAVVAQIALSGAGLAILIPVNTEVAAFNQSGVQLTEDNGSDGVTRPSFYADTSVATTPVVTTLDGTNNVYVVFGAGTPFPSATHGKVYAYQAGPVGALPWPQFHHDARHSGCSGAACAPSGFGGGAYVAVGNLNGGAAREIITGRGAGGTPSIRAFNSFGALLGTDFLGFPFLFSGGARVASCDLDVDGIDDYIVAAGPGGGPHVRALSGVNPAVELASFFAYPVGFTGGVFVACGAVEGPGFRNIVTGADAGGGPHVRVFRYDPTAPGGVRDAGISFFAFPVGFLGGVRVAAADLNGDGRADIIVGAGPGGGPHVRALSGANPAVELASFYAYPVGFTGGVFVAGGTVLGGPKIVTGADAGGGPHVRVFTPTGADAGVGFFAYPIGFTGGVRVAVGDVNGDGQGDIVTGAGPGGGSHVRAFNGNGGALPTSFFAY
jgi:hypothetical protein